MFGAIAGGIASALAGGAMSKLFGGGQKAASGGIQGDVLATDNNTVGMGDAGIKSAIQGSNVPNPDEAVPSFVSGAMAKAGKGLLEGTLQAGTSAVSDKLLDLVGLGGKPAADKGNDTRDYLAAAFPELNAWEPADHDAATEGLAAAGERPFSPPRLQLARTPDDSKRLNDVAGPVIVIAGSGMATGGRILHHLERRLPDPSTIVLFVGYQAAGTLARLLRDGARAVRIFGQEVPVKATVLSTDALSAHADRDEILRWLRGFRTPPAMTYTVHGEPEGARALAETITRTLGWRARPAQSGERVEL